MPAKAVFDIAAAAAAHAAGVPLCEIAKRPGMPCSKTLGLRLRKEGYRVWYGKFRPVIPTESELRDLCCKQRLSYAEIARRFSCGATTIKRLANRYGISPGPGGYLRKRGAGAPRWKGGRIVDGAGYVRLYDPGGEGAYSNGYVLEHRRVASQKLGRPLLESEDVHHIDGNKKNNDPSNLVVVQRGRHQRLHASLHRELLALRAEVDRLRNSEATA